MKIPIHLASKKDEYNGIRTISLADLIDGLRHSTEHFPSVPAPGSLVVLELVSPLMRVRNNAIIGFTVNRSSAKRVTLSTNVYPERWPQPELGKPVYVDVAVLGIMSMRERCLATAAQLQ